MRLDEETLRGLQLLRSGSLVLMEERRDTAVNSASVRQLIGYLSEGNTGHDVMTYERALGDWKRKGWLHWFYYFVVRQ